MSSIIFIHIPVVVVGEMSAMFVFVTDAKSGLITRLRILAGGELTIYERAVVLSATSA